MTGITVNLISQQKLDELTSQEKICYILEEVQKGEILVLEKGLTPEEQTQLIEVTMTKVNPNKFSGIEMQGYLPERNSWFQRLFGRIRPPRMTVIGPADKLKTIHNDNTVIKTQVITK